MTDQNEQHRIQPVTLFHVCPICNHMWQRDPCVHPGVCVKCGGKTYRVFTLPNNRLMLKEHLTPDEQEQQS